MLEDLTLPADVSRVRETPEFSAESVPPGLLRAHRIAAGVWGRLRVIEGSVVFVAEDGPESRRLTAPASQVIEPELPHHIEPSADARFVVEFYR